MGRHQGLSTGTSHHADPEKTLGSKRYRATMRTGERPRRGTHDPKVKGSNPAPPRGDRGQGPRSGGPCPRERGCAVAARRAAAGSPVEAQAGDDGDRSDHGGGRHRHPSDPREAFTHDGDRGRRRRPPPNSPSRGGSPLLVGPPGSRGLEEPRGGDNRVGGEVRPTRREARPRRPGVGSSSRCLGFGDRRVSVGTSHPSGPSPPPRRRWRRWPGAAASPGSRPPPLHGGRAAA